MKTYPTYFILMLALMVASIFSMPSISLAFYNYIECKEGKNKCERYSVTGKKYARCMVLSCGEDFDAKDKKEDSDKKTEIKVDNIYRDTCEIGLRMCSPLRKNLTPYWACMKDVCVNKIVEGKEASCKKGHKLCRPVFNEYKLCVDIICKNKFGDFKECERGRVDCGENLERYWGCVSKECLGDVSHYKILEKKDDPKYRVERDLKGNETIVPVKRKDPMTIWNIDPKYAKAPPGINPRSWVQGIPNERRVLGYPGNFVKCRLSTSYIICRSKDVLDCWCSDGKRAIPKNDITPKYLPKKDAAK